MKTSILPASAAIFIILACAGAAHGAAPERDAVVRGVINYSAAYLRSASSYSSSLETQELMGYEVEILEESSYWKKVRVAQPYEAWVAGGITVMDTAALAKWRNAEKYIATASFGAVLSAPDEASQQICDLVAGCIMGRGKKTCKGFCEVILPDGRHGWTRSKGIAPYAQWLDNQRNASAKEKIASAIAFAKRHLGVPYLWGGMTPKGFDCSGLTLMSYRMAGVVLPRNASQQIKLGRRIDLPTLEDGSFDTSVLKAGDLVFFGTWSEDGSPRPSHVGIYIGNRRIIHSSLRVRINSLCASDGDCYENVHKLLHACRIVE